MSSKICPQIQRESWLKWQEHIRRLSGNGKVTSRQSSYLETLFKKKDIIGWGKEQIRPDEIGKLDVFQALKSLESSGEMTRETRLILAGLTESELKNLKKVS